MNPNLVTFPEWVLPTFLAEFFFVGCRHAGVPAWHENMNFRNFYQIVSYDTFLENLNYAEHNGGEMITIGPFLTDSWMFEIV